MGADPTLANTNECAGCTFIWTRVEREIGISFDNVQVKQTFLSSCQQVKTSLIMAGQFLFSGCTLAGVPRLDITMFAYTQGQRAHEICRLYCSPVHESSAALSKNDPEVELIKEMNSDSPNHPTEPPAAAAAATAITATAITATATATAAPAGNNTTASSATGSSTPTTATATAEHHKHHKKKHVRDDDEDDEDEGGDPDDDDNSSSKKRRKERKRKRNRDNTDDDSDDNMDATTNL